MLEFVRAHDIVVERASASDGEWHFRVLSEEHDRGEVRDLIAASDRDITVNRVVSTVTPEQVSNDTLPLTTVQRETLAVACEQGYFNVPRETTLEELGAEFDISRQAVARRIRRGLNNLVSASLSSE